jgi:hypothetical protein
MTTRTFHGNINPNDIARALVGTFNRNHLIARRSGDERHVVVQIGTRQARRSGGQTALTVNLRTVEDGVSVQIGKQAWFGIFASLGVTALTMLRNPFDVIGRLDDIAADIDSLQLAEKVFDVIEETVSLSGATYQISERLRRLSCEYCGTANAVGQPDCIACGAPLGDAHPTSCSNCGFVVGPQDKKCPNCGNRLV